MGEWVGKTVQLSTDSRRGKATSFKWRDRGESDAPNMPGGKLASPPIRTLGCLALRTGSEVRGSQTLICLEDKGSRSLDRTSPHIFISQMEPAKRAGLTGSGITQDAKTSPP